VQDIPNSTNLEQSVSISYSRGDVSGYLHSAQMEFAGYKVPNQTYRQLPDLPLFIYHW
jgi:hypothetical protein